MTRTSYYSGAAVTALLLLATALGTVAAFLVMVLGPGALPAQAQSTSAGTTFTVNSTADTDDGACSSEPDGCTLREAINKANSDSGIADNILFELGTSATITLGSQLPKVTDAAGLTIDGGGTASITVSGNKQVRVFFVDPGAKLALERLTVADGLGIEAPENSGGGVMNYGTLEVADSTFSGNRARNGGGIFNVLNGNLTVTNSTFSENIAADNNPDGFDLGGGINNNGGTATITGSTFSANSADIGSGGGIIQSDPGQGAVTLKNTIVADSPSGGNCANFGRPLTDGGYNIDDGTTCGFSAANNSQPSTDPLLGPLADNGGPTWTHALGTGSPAIDAAQDLSSEGITADQRGVKRPQGAAWDIGAFELAQATPPPPDKDKKKKHHKKKDKKKKDKKKHHQKDHRGGGGGGGGGGGISMGSSQG